MMALSDEERRKCRLYLDVHEVSRTGMFVGGLPYSDIAQIVELALNDVSLSGETTIRDLLAKMDPMWAELPGVRDRMQAEQVGSIRLRRDEWEARLEQWAFYQKRLATVLDVARFLQPQGSSVQGPWREP